jgi:hypothetical protein
MARGLSSRPSAGTIQLNGVSPSRKDHTGVRRSQGDSPFGARLPLKEGGGRGPLEPQKDRISKLTDGDVSPIIVYDFSKCSPAQQRLALQGNTTRSIVLWRARVPRAARLPGQFSSTEFRPPMRGDQKGKTSTGTELISNTPVRFVPMTGQYQYL